MERLWSIYSNNRGGYAITRYRNETEGYVHVAGPFTWDESAAWIRDNAVLCGPLELLLQTFNLKARVLSRSLFQRPVMHS
jgi:hypothetical protein